MSDGFAREKEGQIVPSIALPLVVDPLNLFHYPLRFNFPVRLA